MTYDLAQRLKNEGFPQEKCSGVWKGSVIGLSTDFVLMVPSLSELISACGEDVGLFEHAGEWNAIKYERIIMMPSEFGLKIIPTLLGLGGKGPTPEEAVARLWLALHKE